ncbi:MAG TPA: prolipoprotein diacylglyceryl transferase, partial [Flavobacteriales bacterium]|nr:prolipoprotein diacylglyceryl transferase [Flavobacteriales bacterium]
MYPTLYHAFLDLFGVDLPFLRPLNSFGFFVAVAFIFASWTLGLELRRMSGLGLLKATTRTVTIGLRATPPELIGQALLGFLLGWKGLYLILNASEVLADFPGFLFSGKGSFIGGMAAGALLAWLRWREKEKAKLAEPRTEQVLMQPQDHAGNITITAAIWGLVGAKVFHWLEYPREFVSFISDPGGSDIISGLTMYGGLIVAGFMVIRYFRKNGIPAWNGADAAAPGVMLAYAIGRIGCQVSGDGDWGVANTAPAPSWLPAWMWSYDYPNNVNAVTGPQRGGYSGETITDGTCFEGYCTHLVPGVYPTPLYETIVCLIFFVVLWSLRKRLKPAGSIFFLFLFLNGLERFFIEKIRVNVAFAGSW